MTILRLSIDPAGHLEPTTYATGANGQVIRGMAFNKNSTLLVVGYEANGTAATTDMFGRDLETNEVTRPNQVT
jgi:hypothetical protein